jgi:drug/metabolite transporter (DMT)-like permease
MSRPVSWAVLPCFAEQETIIMKNKPAPWILYSIAAAFFWGTWGVVAKLISDQVMLLTLPLVGKRLRSTHPNQKGIIWGLIAGGLAISGNVAVYQAFSTGGLAAIVIPVTNLYPLVTIGIALLVFNEKLNWINALGILLAIPAVVILSGESLLFDNPAAFFRRLGLSSWLLYSLVALFFWGIFSVAQKVTTNYIVAEWAYVSFIVSSCFIALVFALAGLINFGMTTQTLLLGTLAGLLNGLGVLASFAAYSAEGKASKVTTVAGALQPVFTIVLAIVFLSENLSFVESLGIVLAIIGALTLSYEKKKTTPKPATGKAPNPSIPTL